MDASSVIFDGILQGLRSLVAQPVIWMLVVLAILVKGVPYLWNEYRYSRAGLQEIDKLSGREFEHYLRNLFIRLGYQVELTKFVGDFGGDLVLSKDGVRTVVQAKRWNRKRVGIKAIQEVYGAKAHYNCTQAVVVTNSFFTPQAKQLARSTDVVLWDRESLSEAILEAPGLKSPSSQGPRPTQGTSVTESPCPRCGSQLVSRKGKRGPFIGCSAYPRCRYTENA